MLGEQVDVQTSQPTALKAVTPHSMRGLKEYRSRIKFGMILLRTK